MTVPGSCTDVAGNTAPATFGPLNYDHTPPTVTITSALGLEVLDVGQSVAGTAGDNLSGVLFVGVAFKMAGAAQITLVATCTAGCGTTAAAWAASTKGLAAGLYTVNAQSVDIAGNISQSATISLLLL